MKRRKKVVVRAVAPVEGRPPPERGTTEKAHLRRAILDLLCSYRDRLDSKNKGEGT